jgi:hypothetical protein
MEVQLYRISAEKRSGIQRNFAVYRTFAHLQRDILEYGPTHHNAQGLGCKCYQMFEIQFECPYELEPKITHIKVCESPSTESTEFNF